MGHSERALAAKNLDIFSRKLQDSSHACAVQNDPWRVIEVKFNGHLHISNGSDGRVLAVPTVNRQYLHLETILPP